MGRLLASALKPMREYSFYEQVQRKLNNVVFLSWYKNLNYIKQKWNLKKNESKKKKSHK